MRLLGIALLLFIAVPLVGMVTDREARRQRAVEQCRHHRTFVEKGTSLRRPCVTRPSR